MISLKMLSLSTILQSNVSCYAMILHCSECPQAAVYWCWCQACIEAAWLLAASLASDPGNLQQPRQPMATKQGLEPGQIAGTRP